MTTFDRVMKTILLTIDEFNEQLSEDKKIAKSTDAVLYGKSGQLDSVELLNLLVEIELNVEAEFGVVVTVADEEAMDREKDPFETISSLAKYVARLLEESSDR